MAKRQYGFPLDNESLTGLLRVADTIGAWGEATFPKHTSATIMTHIYEQAQQLGAAIGTDREAERIADMLILLFALAYHDGPDVAVAIEDKHLTNQQRTWGAPDQAGVQHHSEHIPGPADIAAFRS